MSRVRFRRSFLSTAALAVSYRFCEINEKNELPAKAFQAVVRGYGQLITTAGAAALQNITAVCCGHAFAESVNADTTSDFRLISTFGSHSLHLHRRGRARSRAPSPCSSARQSPALRDRQSFQKRSIPRDTVYATAIITDFFPRCQPLFSRMSELFPQTRCRGRLRLPQAPPGASADDCPQPLCASPAAPRPSSGASRPKIDAKRPVRTPFPAAVSAPNGPLTQLTAFQTLFHSLLWIFSLCGGAFCAIMGHSYDRVILRIFAAAGALRFSRLTRREKRF